MWTHVVRTHICLCPCECSHLEPLWIHTCAHKCIYIYIFHHRYFYIWTNLGRTHTYVCALASAHTLRSCLYTCIWSQAYLWYIINTLVLPMFFKLTYMSVPLRVLTLRTSLYTYIYIYSQVYIFHITDIFIYEPMLCELTYVCALASAHT